VVIEKSKIANKKGINIVEAIVKNAPIKKTTAGEEKKILIAELKKKYSA
jgi:hypothetical protein